MKNVITTYIGVIKILLVLWDSLRLDSVGPFKDIFEKSTWSSYRTIEGFTAPVLAATITGKTPEELGMTRTPEDFELGLDPSKIDDTIFDHFESYITVGRLEGSGPASKPPSRRGNKIFLPPIKWNAFSNWDPHILEIIGRKHSHNSPSYWDFEFYHSFVSHGPFSLVTGLGPKECPEVKNCDRLMQRMSVEELRRWYMMGINNAATFLRSINEMCGGLETIISFADHGECISEKINGRRVTGHFAGMHEKLDSVGIVPIWINQDTVIPEDIGNTKIKDFVIEMHKEFEVENESYQNFKKYKLDLISKYK